jgi:hypothetical protein
MGSGYYIWPTSIVRMRSPDCVALYTRICKNNDFLTLITSTAENNEAGLTIIREILLHIYGHPPLRAWYHVQNRFGSENAQLLASKIMLRIQRMDHGNQHESDDVEYKHISETNWRLFKLHAPTEAIWWTSCFVHIGNEEDILAFDKKLYPRNNLYETMNREETTTSIRYNEYWSSIRIGHSLQTHPKSYH